MESSLQVLSVGNAWDLIPQLGLMMPRPRPVLAERHSTQRRFLLFCVSVSEPTGDCLLAGNETF